MRSSRSIITFVGVCLVALVAPAALAATPATGDLDPGWNGDGIAGVPSNYSIAMAPLESGRLFAAAYRDADQGQMRVLRFEADGAPSTLSNGAGTILRKFSPSAAPSVSFPSMLRLTRLSKPVIVGEYYTGTGRLGVARLLTTGAYDNSFSGDGRVTYQVFPTPKDEVAPFSAAVLPNGKTVVALAGFSGDAYVAQSVVRLNSNGTLDTTFSGDGKHPLPLNDGDVAVASNGSMFINSPSGSIEKIRKVNPAATGVDTTFSGDGRLEINCGDHDGMDLNVDSAGRLTAVCLRNLDTSGELRFFRFTALGAPDTTFSGDGQLSRTFAIGTTEWDARLAFSGTGEAWVATNTAGDPAVVKTYKLTEAGEPDARWSGDGEATTSLGFAYGLDDIAVGPTHLFVATTKSAQYSAIAALEARLGLPLAPVGAASAPKPTGSAPAPKASTTAAGTAFG